MMASGATITLIRNDHRQEKSVVNHPPITGPKAAATPAVAPQAAKAVARSRPVKAPDRIDNVVGIINEAPIPSMIASPAMSSPTEVDIEASSDPTPKRAAPIMKILRWP